MDRVDVLVVGSGIAGLTVALATNDRDVLLVSAGSPGFDGSSHLAQGGMAAALDSEDSPDQHAQDTLIAADGLADPTAVKLLTRLAADAIVWLEAKGVVFDHQEGRRLLCREAAHSHPRIVHAGGDATGDAVMRALWSRFIGSNNCTALTGTRAVALSKADQHIQGAWLIDAAGASRFVAADQVVLACGGSGGLFRHSTNPDTVIGSGIALALGCGARLKDLEFIQFHPTALDVDKGGLALPLVTEALRGAGARLIDSTGRRFMSGVHPDAELAPRNVVASAIHRLQQHGEKALLDATDSVGPAFAERFPTVFAHCRDHGIDPRHQPIPVTPAAHYHMGGVDVDHWGRTSINGLWACGEAACTGVHGANRLASNSLVEGVVFGRRVARAIGHNPPGKPHCSPNLDPPAFRPEAGLAFAIREAMWQYAGLERSESGLRVLLGKLQDWRHAEHGQIEAAMLTAASAITRSALARKQSVGAHIRVENQYQHSA